MDEAKEPGFWATKVAGRVQAHGMAGAAKKSLGEMKNAFTGAGEGARMKGFARVGAVGVGTYIAAGALQSRDADGNERSALARLGNLVVGGGMIAGGLLAGGR
ncbi:MAG: hypothetical protein SFW64_06900 [Alphaproteobacteria bacterium]|nr:hypothetical protein [Alphaproteobacteria bacterium]